MHHMGSIDYEASAYSRHGAVRSGRDDDDDDHNNGARTSHASKNYSYYDDSKFYMNLLTMEINRRYGFKDQQSCSNSGNTRHAAIAIGDLQTVKQPSSRPIIAVSANPGAVRSDIWRHVPPAVMWIYDLFMRMAYLSVDQGSATSVYAALVSIQELRKKKYLTIPGYLNPNTMNEKSSESAGIYPATVDTEPSRQFNKGYGSSDAGAGSSTVSSSGTNSFLLSSPYPEDAMGGKWCDHPLVPYIIPYFMPFQLMAFELLGAYNGPSFGKISLPARSAAVAEGLWQFSEKLCVDIAGKASNTQLLNTLKRSTIMGAKRLSK
jgi:hypothetical protein